MPPCIAAGRGPVMSALHGTRTTISATAADGVETMRPPKLQAAE